MFLPYNWDNHEQRKVYFVTLGTQNIDKVAYDLPFQSVAPQWADTTWFITKLATPVFWDFSFKWYLYQKYNTITDSIS